MILKESVTKASSLLRSHWCFSNIAWRFIWNCRVASFEAQQILYVQHAFIFSYTAGTSSSKMVSFISAFHSCAYLLVYSGLRAGLPACFLKEQALNLPLWEVYWQKVILRLWTLLQGAVRYLLSLEALTLDMHLVANFSLVLVCCGIWKITAFQHRVLHGGLWEVRHLL